MKAVLPRSFYIIRGIVYFFMFLSVMGCFFIIFRTLIPSISGGKPLPFTYQTQKIGLNVSGRNGHDVLSLQYFRFEPRAKQPEGNITIHSKTGRSYSGFYSSELEKLRVTVPADFTRNLQWCGRIIVIVNSLLIFMVFYVTATLLNSLESGSPFTLRNAKYIAFIAAITFYFTVLDFVLDWMLQSYIQRELSLIFKIMPNPGIMTALLFAMVLAVFSYILRQGVRMKEEQDLTI